MKKGYRNKNILVIGGSGSGKSVPARTGGGGGTRAAGVGGTRCR